MAGNVATLPSGSKSPSPSSAQIRDALDALETVVFLDETVKEAIAGFLVRRYMASRKGRILCFAAPKGMGKTAVAAALCNALSLHMTTISAGRTEDARGNPMGGVRSDLNAIAGRICHALNTSDPNTAAILLEDIDRIDMGTANPSVDFFEVLSHVQDFAVRNRYQKTVVDISKTLFLATARNLAAVPSGLREKLTSIPLPAYSEDAKLFIATRHMLPDLKQRYGLGDDICISDNAFLGMIRNYTREAGVAGLRSLLETIFQKASRIRVEEGERKIQVRTNTLRKYLGPPQPVVYPTSRNEIGVVRVLGRNDKGGCILVLEVLALPGSGRLIFTGNTDRIFQESAQVALSYIRYRAEALGVPADFHRTHDIHVHMMEAEKPKYGVSAGVAIATAMVSALVRKPVKGDAAMTGEISLYGKVLGVGDIRDKVLAAHQAGIRHVFIPDSNNRDALDIPKSVLERITIHQVGDVAQILGQTLIDPKER